MCNSACRLLSDRLNKQSLTDCKYLFLSLFPAKDEPDGVKPEITPATTPVEVTEGTVAKLSCRVSGSPKPTVTWLKEGENVVLDSRVTGDTNEDVSSLYFKETVLDDEGEYECKAQNAFGSATCILELLVNEAEEDEQPQVKPEFVQKIKDVNAFEGDSPCFSVRVEGNPKPEVQWFTADKEITADGRFFVESFIDDRYTMTIHDCEIKDQGRYKCVASNAAGKAVCSGALTVKEKMIPPHFADQASEVPMQIDKGGDITLAVELKGKPKPSVKWYKDDKPISRSSSKYRTEVKEDNYQLTIIAATPDDEGTYQCKATSPAGTATRDFHVHIEGNLFRLTPHFVTLKHQK